jgi:hypothetical protein
VESQSKLAGAQQELSAFLNFTQIVATEMWESTRVLRITQRRRAPVETPGPAVSGAGCPKMHM